MSSAPVIETTVLEPVQEKAIGGGLEGAQRNSRELLRYTPAVISPDQQINPVKEMADARGRDSVQNDGYAMGAVHTHRDSIVGSQFRLNCEPEYELLGTDEGWADEFQAEVETKFNLLADSAENYFDASGVNTLTGLMRLAVGGFLFTGEVLGTAEWKRAVMRPFATAVQMVSPSRLSNPNDQTDTRYLRRGVKRDIFGEAQSFFIRQAHPNEGYDWMSYTWDEIPARKPWGRRQVLHIIEQLQVDQTRGVSDMISVMKQMRMTKRFQDVVLQNAVVNASYAAAIESELPREVVFAQAGAGNSGFKEMLGDYMMALNAYAGASQNSSIDGVKIPHFFPGTKLSLKPMGTPGGVGTEFEEALLRHTAAALGLSYEQFSKDYTKTNYSSARASMGETWKYMQSRKKVVADRFATMIYVLWFEEMWNAGEIPRPPGMSIADYYKDPIKREALLACDWIGASRGQIDELKETQAAVMRINSGLSTYAEESARLGKDFRRVFKQRAREEALKKKLNLTFASDATTPGANDAQQTMTQDQGGDAQQSN